jgi:hypothetical protein
VVVISQDVDVTGNFFIDEEVLTTKLGASKSDLAKYSVTPGVPLMPDFYVGDFDAYNRWAKAGELIGAMSGAVSSWFKK